MRRSFLLPLSLLLACSEQEMDSMAPMPPAGIDPMLRATLSQGGRVPVIAELDHVALDEEVRERFPGIPTTDSDLRQFRRDRIYDFREEILRDNPDVIEERSLSSLPYLILSLDREEQLDRLAASPLVLQLHAEQSYRHQLTQSLGLIHQPEAEASGHTGAGASVAVLDTGVDYTHSAFGSCSSTGGSCKVTYAADVATSDGSRDDDGHGTNVAGIVLGVAPDAGIIALDVFRPNGYAYSSDLLVALDWVIDNQDSYNIQAINMSLGGGRYYSDCSTDLLAYAVQSARDAGILSAIASGNNTYSDSISSPACVPAAVTVGAVYDTNLGGLAWSVCTDYSTAADQITCFSNSDDTVELLAPGAVITAAGQSMGGTSQATPHVAGAIAVLRTAWPDDSATQTLERLSSTGTVITDSRNGLSFPRIDLDAAVELAPASDSTPPTGTLSINSGGAATRSSSVTLSLSASDDTAVTEMCISNTASCSAWLSYSGSSAWTLSATGNRTVYAWFRDAAGNVSSAVSDSIIHDTTTPTNGTVVATAGDAQASISWSGYADASSGIASYKMVYSTSTPSASCTNGNLGYSGSDSSTTLTGLVNGTTTYVRVCAIDQAGNTSTGSTTSFVPAPEVDAPTGGTVLINSGADWTSSRTVTLSLSASDASGVAKMCISNGSTCSSWVTYTTSKSWSMTSTNGDKTVYVWFRDIYGNSTSAAVSDSIGLDSVAPSNGTLTATGADASASLSWSGYSDSGSGIASYKLVGSSSSTPSSGCTNGTVLWTGTGNSTSLSGLSNGSTTYLRLCAIDAAGKTSTGATASVRPAPEYSGPTLGSVSINGGASSVNSTRVSLSLYAEDPSGVSGMCISNTSTCSSWLSYATSKSWTMSSAGKVYVSFRDVYNNVSSAVYDTITYDATKPTNGVVVATPAAGGVMNLSWSDYSDRGTGLASYTVVYAAGRSAPSSCSTGTVLSSGSTATTASLTGVPGETWSFRVCAMDGAGNLSSGTSVTTTAVE